MCVPLLRAARGRNNVFRTTQWWRCDTIVVRFLRSRRFVRPTNLEIGTADRPRTRRTSALGEYARRGPETSVLYAQRVPRGSESIEGDTTNLISRERPCVSMHANRFARVHRKREKVRVRSAILTCTRTCGLGRGLRTGDVRDECGDDEEDQHAGVGVAEVEKEQAPNYWFDRCPRVFGVENAENTRMKKPKPNRNRNRDSSGCRSRARRSESAMGGFLNRPSPKTPVQSSRTGTADHATLTRYNETIKINRVWPYIAYTPDISGNNNNYVRKK